MSSQSIWKLAGSAVVATLLALPLSARAQESKEDAEAQVHHHNARHHTKAKFIGGGVAGGAATGAMVGGPAGAVVGGAVGGVGGAVANKIHHHHQVKEHEKYDTPQNH
jgi:hypothetical protein